MIACYFGFFSSTFSKKIKKKNSEKCQAVVWLYFVMEAVIIAVKITFAQCNMQFSFFITK